VPEVVTVTAFVARMAIADEAKSRGISFNIYALSLIISGAIILTFVRKINDNKGEP
jgi:hypothetical protein